jgi:hypothetical protein
LANPLHWSPLSPANAPPTPESVVVLDEETVPRDGALPKEEVSTAETVTELADLWQKYHLTRSRPAIDFGRRVVVSFIEDGFCNQGTMTGLVITTAGELVPQFRIRHDICDLMGSPPHARVYVLSIPRGLLSAGGYVVRDGFSTSPSFSVKGTAPPRASFEPLSLPPPPPLPGAHPRRARLLLHVPDELHVASDLLEASPTERPAVWVRDDAAWFPMLRADMLPDGFYEPPQVELACDADACARVLVVGECKAPECPTGGYLAITERPVKSFGTWPTEPGPWENLMRELAADPWLAGTVPAGLDGPRPREISPGWATRDDGSIGDRSAVELALGAEVGRFASEDAAFAGIDMRLGWRWEQGCDCTGTGPLIREVTAGDGWGVDFRARGLWEAEAPRSARRWVILGVSVAADNALGRDSSNSRVRVPSLLEAVLPEVGIIFASDGAPSFVTTNSLPVTLLLRSRVALELRPAWTLRFDSPHGAGPDGLLSISLSMMLR